MCKPSPPLLAVAPYVTEDNLDALMIYPAPKGGWHADIVLKETPPGIPNVMGTPVGRPCPTRADAEEIGKRLLVSMLILAARNQSPPEKLSPVFTINGWAISLPAEAYDYALSEMPHMRNGYGTQLQAAARVEQILDKLCPEGFDGEAFGNWPAEKQAALLTVLITATLSGLLCLALAARRGAGNERLTL